MKILIVHPKLIWRMLIGESYGLKKNIAPIRYSKEHELVFEKLI
jgi:hypothetical protein